MLDQVGLLPGALQVPLADIPINSSHPLSTYGSTLSSLPHLDTSMLLPPEKKPKAVQVTAFSGRPSSPPHSICPPKQPKGMPRAYVPRTPHVPGILDVPRPATSPCVPARPLTAASMARVPEPDPDPIKVWSEEGVLHVCLAQCF